MKRALHRRTGVLLSAMVAAPHAECGEASSAFLEVRTSGELIVASPEDLRRLHLARSKRLRRFVFGRLPRTTAAKTRKLPWREIGQAKAAEVQSA
jgi:fatty-acyl-CoA synthase